MCTLSLPPFSLTSFPLLWQAALSAALEGDEEEVTFATADSLPQAGPYVQVTKTLINYSVLFCFILFLHGLLQVGVYMVLRISIISFSALMIHDVFRVPR